MKFFKGLLLSTFMALPLHDSVTIANTKIDTPYYQQRNNFYEPGNTCGITSAAMLIGYWQKKLNGEEFSPVTPDEIYVQFGKRIGQSPDTLASLYSEFELDGDFTYTGTRQDIKDQLDLGYPVVVHGWFTRNGHIILLTGYDEKGFWVNDPAGNWARCFKCGYYKGSSGAERHYSYDELNKKVLGEDGDIWMSYAH